MLNAASGRDAALPISASEPDWSRERYAHLPWRGRMMIRAVRGYQAKGRLWRLRKALWKGLHWWASLLAQCDIPLNLQVAGGLLIPHPQGIIINNRAVIGQNALIFQAGYHWQQWAGRAGDWRACGYWRGRADHRAGPDWRSCADRGECGGDTGCASGSGGSGNPARMLEAEEG